MRHLLIIGILATVACVISCTNLEVDPLQGRFDDNFSGEVAAPANIDPPGNNSFTFAVMSDIHVGSPGGQMGGSFLDRVKADGDAFVLLLGDSTDTGQEDQYTKLRDMMQERTLTYRAAIGNHDIFFGGWTYFKKYVGRSIYSFNADNVHITAIDCANGVLGQQQLEWIENDLKNATQEHKIVISHFPAWNGSFSNLYKMSSEEEAAILKDMLYRYGVKIMFAGHYHGFNETEIGGVKYIVTGGANDLIDPGNSQHYVRVTVNGSDIQTTYVPFP